MILASKINRYAFSPLGRSPCVLKILLLVSGSAYFCVFDIPYISPFVQRRQGDEFRVADYWMAYDCPEETAEQRVRRPNSTRANSITRILGEQAVEQLAYREPAPRNEAAKSIPDVDQVSNSTSFEMLGLSANSEPFKIVRNLPRVKRLVLFGPIDFHDLETTPPMLSVTTFILGGQCRTLTDSVGSLIARKFPGLCELEIDGGFVRKDGLPQLSDKGLSEFRRLPNLTKISVKNCPNISPAGIADFSGSHTLKELSGPDTLGSSGKLRCSSNANTRLPDAGAHSDISLCPNRLG